MHTDEELADLIFPDIHETIADLDRRFPPRSLSQGAEVTRFAPSPTGFLHTGSLFTAMVSAKVARQSGGVFFVRLEDTDQKREVEGSGKMLIDQLKIFGIVPDEGYLGDIQKGAYGPYIQSERSYIYKVCIKELIRKGRAYPCFCTADELNLLRMTQEAERVIPGYYGQYAKCRYLTEDQAYDRIRKGDSFVIRFKSEGNHGNFIKIRDEVRGILNLPENDQDIVIMKSDGLPTYHFAHACDDHFMHTTIVTRGEEWISSLPIHIELFQALGFEAPKYAHLPVIMKLDNGNKRKLSKRKDKEAAVSYFIEQGYPVEGFIKYLMTIANSNFEEWLSANPKASVDDFVFSFGKMSLDGALFDLPKLEDICKETLAYYPKEKIAALAADWAAEHDPKLSAFIKADYSRFVAILDIEREQEKPRKDYIRYSDIYPHIRFFSPEEYDLMLSEAKLPFSESLVKSDVIAILSGFADSMDYSLDETAWFDSVKALGEKHGFAPAFKLYRKNPSAYKGHVGDVAGIIRIALTTSAQSPNLYAVLHILGREEVNRRLESVIGILKQDLS